MQVDPKVSAWLNVVAAVVGVIATLGAQLTTILGSGTSQTVVTTAGIVVTIIAAINGGLHGVSGPTPGPLSKGN